MGSGTLRAAVSLLLLVTLAAAWPSKDDTSVEGRLALWLLSKGAKLTGFKIGQECPTCLRGVIATKNFAPNEVIMKIPFKSMIRFNQSSAYPAELAHDMLDRMHNDPSFNDTFSLFWQAHPGPDEVFTPELYTDEQLEMLQTPELEELARRQRDVTEQVFLGTYASDPPAPPMAQVAPAVTLDTFKHVASLINSRSFGFYCDEQEQAMCTHLVPLLDLVNHDEEANAERTGDGQVVTLSASRHIKKGQEIRHNYFWRVIHRPDMSLLYFGFVADREAPLLASVDLPGYSEADPFSETAPDDSDYDDPKGKYVTRKEHKRLAARLAAAATTLEQDEALLGSGAVTDWRMRTLLQYRIARKRALRLNMAKIAKHLGLKPKKAAAAPSGEQAAGEEGAKDEL